MAITMKNYYLQLGLAILLSTNISACDWLKQFMVTRDVALDTLNDSIQKMGQQSNNWQTVLEETRDKLIKEGRSTLAEEVSNVISRATSDVGIEAKCFTDFLRDRSKEDLVKLRATITGEKLELKPVFCSPTPSSINMNIPSDRRPVIEIAGYNLTASALKVFMVGRDLPKMDVSDKLSNPTSYLLTLNGDEKSIGIIQPVAPPPKPQFLNSRIHVTGTVDLKDSETFGSDENHLDKVDTYIDVKSDGGASYHWEYCVGGEVQGYVDAKLQLDKNTGLVSVQGMGRYYEGTRCGPTNSRVGNRPFNFQLRPGQSYNYQATLSDDEGHVIYNLNFKNEN
jgi:hypothetical protein